MKEIEILNSLQEKVTVADVKIKDFAFSNGDKFEYKGNKHVVDTYFSSKVFNDLDPDDCGRLRSSLRLRQKDNEAFITHKYDNFDGNGIWVYSNEIETRVYEVKALTEILKALHFENLITIDNHRLFYESTNYEIVLEDVVQLGTFVEIEYKSDVEINENEIDDIRERMRTIIANIGLFVGEELNAGKPELMLKKINSLKLI